MLFSADTHVSRPLSGLLPEERKACEFTKSNTAPSASQESNTCPSAQQVRGTPEHRRALLGDARLRSYKSRVVQLRSHRDSGVRGKVWQGDPKKLQALDRKISRQPR